MQIGRRARERYSRDFPPQTMWSTAGICRSLAGDRPLCSRPARVKAHQSSVPGGVGARERMPRGDRGVIWPPAAISYPKERPPAQAIPRGNPELPERC